MKILNTSLFFFGDGEAKIRFKLRRRNTDFKFLALVKHIATCNKELVAQRRL